MITFCERIRHFFTLINNWCFCRLRRWYYKFKKRKLRNLTPTIIASDCFGAFVYHNLGLEFRSPTINLAIPKEDFWTFTYHLKAFLNAEVREAEDQTEEYPVGSVTADGETIRLHFIHYNTFEQAKEKWEERKKRVSYDNIYIIQLIPDPTAQDIECFDRIPFKNKMLVTRPQKEKTDCRGIIAEHPVFLKENYKPGEVLHYPSEHSIKRYMDDIDYVSFLNQPH